MSELLAKSEIAQQLLNWKVEDDKIERVFEFKDFRASISFVNKVADLAEEAKHHPEIEINYNKVEIELSTHSVGGVTETDIRLAKQIEGVL